MNLRHLRFDDVATIFAADDRTLLEEMAYAAREATRQYFGRAIGLYAPLYIANYCQNQCTYCGFQAHSKVERSKLTYDQIDTECRALAATGIRSCLILTGESRHHSPPSYIEESIRIAARYFANVALEVYPVSTDEYRSWYCAGADGVTLYQETYDRILYDELHIAGPKKDYDYRIQAPQRVADAGFRQFSMGALLGLADWRKDVPALFAHLRYLEKKFPGVEYGISFPRLRRVEGDEHYHFDVSDRDMLKIICTARLLFPRTGINLSTREEAKFRDDILPFGITRISAGSLTSVGGYVNAEKNYQEGQFEVHDRRSFDEIKAMLVKKGYDPVVTDWRCIVNE